MNETMSETTKAALDDAIMRLVLVIASERICGHIQLVQRFERHLTALCDEANLYTKAH